MTDHLAVILGERLAGRLERGAGGALRFHYADAHRLGPDPTPLSASMPLTAGTHEDVVVEPWLWGLLPDNDAVLARWGRTFRVSARSVYALLGTPIGEDCPGAVRFVGSDAIESALSRDGAVEWLSDADVAARLRDLRSDATSWLGRASNGHFSLAGAQAKTALLLRDGRWGVPDGSIPTTHILKPAVAGFEGHDLNEHLCLDAAGRAGLVVARTEVRRFGDASAIVVERYDRQTVDGVITRIHQEDACQALGVHPARKYQADGGPGAGDIAALLRRVVRPAAAEEDVARFADALIWNWLIAGTDGHAKNYALLLAGRQARLAPLYDIASALPYGEHEKKLRFAMKIGGDYRVYPYRSTWNAAAVELGLAPEALLARVHTLAARAPDAFADAARDPGVAALGSDMPSRLVDLVADRTARCRRILR